MVPLPEYEEKETTEIHTACPFCTGEYVKRRGCVSHSSPVCQDFERRPAHEFLIVAAIAESQKIAREVHR